MGFLCESRSIGLVGSWNYRCFDGIGEVRAFFAAWKMVDEEKNRGCV
jgi:hypothetical protein